MELAGKMELAGFGVLRKWHFGAAEGGFRPKRRNLQLAGSKDGGWVYTDTTGKSKTEILGRMIATQGQDPASECEHREIGLSK